MWLYESSNERHSAGDPLEKVMKTKSNSTTPTASKPPKKAGRGSPLPRPCSPKPERPECKAVTWDGFAAALDAIKPGECVELHHPEGAKAPTRMGHCTHTQPDGRTINLWAGCWCRKDDGIIVWTYSAMSFNAENAKVEARGK